MCSTVCDKTYADDNRKDAMHLVGLEGNHYKCLLPSKTIHPGVYYQQLTKYKTLLGKIDRDRQIEKTPSSRLNTSLLPAEN